MLSALLMVTSLAFNQTQPKADITINTVKECLRFHEHPEQFAGKTVEFNRVVWWITEDLVRDKETDGYIFEWKAAPWDNFDGAERIGKNLLLVEDKMNFWCDTDSGLKLKKEIPTERKGGTIFYNRSHLTFKVVVKEFDKKKYHIAELVWVKPYL